MSQDESPRASGAYDDGGGALPDPQTTSVSNNTGAAEPVLTSEQWHAVQEQAGAEAAEAAAGARSVIDVEEALDVGDPNVAGAQGDYDHEQHIGGVAGDDLGIGLGAGEGGGD